MNSRTTDENKPPIREELHMRKKSYYTNIFEDIENRVQELNSRLSDVMVVLKDVKLNQNAQEYLM